MGKEIRSFSDKCSPRIVEDRTIEGYALVFNQESRIMYDFEKRHYFKEIIKPSAITKELIERSDVKALLEHDNKRMLARSFNGKGTLHLEVDEIGLKYRFIAPNTSDGDYAVEMISRGDIFGSSFAYTSDEEHDIKYSRDKDGYAVRTVEKFSGIYDVSPVSDPAYFQTSVSVRAIQDVLGLEKEDTKYIEQINELKRLINE